MGNNHSPIRTTMGSNKKGMNLQRTDAADIKKKPKLKDSDKNENVTGVELDSPTSVTL